MKYPIYNQSGKKVKEIGLNPKIFDLRINEGLVHQVVIAQMANKRQPLAHTKTRGEVRGGGRKPWRQKGTGRARAGSIRSPLWRGGGITFGPRKEKEFRKKINKKMKRKALFMCLTGKVKSNWLVLLDKLELDKGKTKEMVATLNKIGKFIDVDKSKIPSTKSQTNSKSQIPNSKHKDKKAKIKKQKLSLLIILPKSDPNITRSARNIPGVKVVKSDSLNVVDILKYKYMLAPIESLDVIERTYLLKTKN